MHLGLGQPDAPGISAAGGGDERKMNISVRSVAALILVVGAVGSVVVYNYPPKPGWAGIIDTSFWNYWLQLLIILLVLAIGGGAVGGYFFARSQSRTAQAIAERRGQDEALQTYL